MLASLDHVARIADRRTDRSASAVLRRWAKAAQASFLTAVDTGLAAAGRDDLLDVRLLGPFLVEQECRDLVYAARHLPRWRYAPWGTLAAWFGTAPDDPSRDFPWT
jgi:maltokinase